jgi:hypothetical protein
MVLPSPQSVLSKVLTSSKHDKWGFVVCRCTYQDDYAWERFKQIFRERTQQALQNSDTPEVVDSHEWTFVDDRAALDGASRPQLRECFNNWAAHAIATEQPRAKAEIERDPTPTFGIPRYNYFIQVDDEVLQSVIADPELGPFGEGVVNFVDSQWKPLGERTDPYGVEGHDDCEDYEDYEDEDEVLGPIDGCTEGNVGWMKLQASTSIGAEFYLTVYDYRAGDWYVAYQRPPELVMW